MKYIRKRYKNDCAITSLAMLTSIAYEKIRKATHPKRKFGKSIPGTLKSTVIRFLKKRNIKHRIRVNRIKLRDLKHNAYVAYWTPHDEQHAVVWNAKSKKILDPEFPKPRPKSYIDDNIIFVIELI